MKPVLITAALLLTTAPPALADTWLGDWESSGDVGLELRYFPSEPRWPGQSDDPGISLAFNGEAYWRGGQFRASVKPFLRLDSTDSERSHYDLREAYMAFEGDDWEILAGSNKVFWGVTESRHLVDIINQTDLVEDPDQEQKLGQPMISALLQRDWGQLEAFVMPWFRERTFPGAAGRLRTALPVDTNRPIYESGAKQAHTDLALRWSHYFGDLDIGSYVFHGTGREPKLLPSEVGLGPRPLYHLVTQAGLDAQYTRDAWLWKLEAVARKGLNDTFFASVGGLEYTFFGVRDSRVDVGILVEYLYDGRGPTEPVTLLDDDVFVGTRLAWNDASDTAILAGVTLDRDGSEWLFNLEAERRFGYSLAGTLRLRLFRGDHGKQGLWPVDRDNYLEVRLTRYF